LIFLLNSRKLHLIDVISLNSQGPPSGWGVVLIGCAIETLRAEVSLHAASTPAVEAALVVGYGNDVGESNETMACNPRLGLQRGFVVVLSGRCGIAENLVPSLLTEIR
jgi:hypothetical protein